MEIQRPQQPLPISISLDLDSFGQVSINKLSRIEQNRSDILDCIRFSTIFNLTQQIHYTKLLTLKSVAGGRVVSALDCYAEGFLFKSHILPLLKHAYGEQQPAAIDLLAIKRLAAVTPEVKLRESHVCLHQVWIRLPTLVALKSRGDITRSPKQRYQWPHKRTCVHQNLKEKS